MVAALPKSRLAIGIYDDVLGLTQPVSELLSLGVGANQFGFMAQQGTINRILRPPDVPADAWNVLAPLLLQTETLVDCRSPLSVVASRGLTDLVPAGPRRDWTLNQLVAGNSSARALTAVRDHIRAGRAALAVASKTSEQQWQIARVLLKSSAYPVETHEFSHVN